MTIPQEFWPMMMGISAGVGLGVALHERLGPRGDSAPIEAAAQSEAACRAVAERMGIVVTIPPWQAMVLTPILDPR